MLPHDIEISTQDNQESFWYEFMLQRTESGAGGYEPLYNLYSRKHAIQHGDLQHKGGADAQPVELKMSADLALAKLMDEFPPARAVRLAIRKYRVINPDNEDDPLNWATIWMGECTGWEVVDEANRILNAEPMSLVIAQGGLRMTWARLCPHVLYDPLTCSANKNLFGTGVPSLGVPDRLRVRSPAFASRVSGYFTGGVLEWNRTIPEQGGGTKVIRDQRSIDMHYGDTIEMLGGTAGISEGAAGDIYAGCPRTLKACHEVFDNAPNFGGVFIDGKSPFDGNPTF